MFQSLYLVFLVGCSSNPLINHFDLPEGAGARLDCSWNGRLNDGQVNLFEGYNGTELNHGPNVAGKAAKYRVPSGPAIINVKINWMVTIFGPIRQAHAEFSLNLKEDASYEIDAVRNGTEVVIKIRDGEGSVVTQPVMASFGDSIPIPIVAPI